MTLQDAELEIEELKTQRFKRVMYSVADSIGDSEAIARLTDEIDELEQLADDLRQYE